MMRITVRAGLVSMALSGLVALAAGCGGAAGTAGTGGRLEGEGPDEPIVKAEYDPAGWWCGRHGVPADECSVCSYKRALECKAKGDWCDEHGRARSQCFHCEPALKAKFAAKHWSKFGSNPPPTGDEAGTQRDADTAGKN